MSEKINAQGTTFEVLLADGTTWQAICASSISGLGAGAAAEIDTTTLCSTAKEFKQGLKDEGTINIVAPYDPSDVGIKRCQYLRDNRENGSFRITLADSGNEVHSFTAAVPTCGLSDMTPDTIYEINIALRVSGAITVA